MRRPSPLITKKIVQLPNLITFKQYLYQGANCFKTNKNDKCVSNEDKTLPISDFNKILLYVNSLILENNNGNKDDIGLLLLNCQPVGGFKVDPNVLKGRGSIQNILSRLYAIASKNLVAITEAGDNNVHQTDAKLFEGNNEIQLTVKCKVGEKIDDNAFIYLNNSDDTVEYLFSPPPTNQNRDPQKTVSYHKGDPFSNLKYISSYGINILNVHLPSNGPKKETAIESFLDNCLPTLNELGGIIPHIILGDSNITLSKIGITDVDDVDARNRLMKRFRQKINNLYQDDLYEWALLMNPTKVNKIRTYVFLLNQQINKSNKKEAIEADGTFIAIRYLKSKRIEREWNTYMNGGHFGKDWELCTTVPLGISIGGASNGGPSVDGEVTRSEDSTNVDFLQFDYEISGCLDGNGKLMDRLFIDHTPVQISIDAIKFLLGDAITGTPSWNNIIVLNCGSIVNSSKSWKPTIMNYVSEIMKHDLTLFKKIRKLLSTDDLSIYIHPYIDNQRHKDYDNDYKNFVGDAFGKLPITYTSNPSKESTFHKFATAMYETELNLRKDKGLLTSLGYTAPNAPVNVL